MKHPFVHISRFFLLALSAVLSMSALADTRYDFSFQTDNSITVSGYFYLSDSWSSNGTWQTVTSFSGSLNVGSQTDIQSGSFTSFSIRDDEPFLFRFTVNGIVYTANFGGGTVTATGYELSYQPSGATFVTTQILNPDTTPSAPDPTPVASAAAVPEIDAGRLPQALLLISFLLVAAARRGAVQQSPLPA